MIEYGSVQCCFGTWIFLWCPIRRFPSQVIYWMDELVSFSWWCRRVTALAYVLLEYSFKLALGLFVGAPLGAVLLGWITGWMNLLALTGGAVAGLTLFTVWGHFIEMYPNDGD